MMNRVSPDVTETVFHGLLRTWGLLRQVQEPYFARFGISPSQWAILRVLQRAELKGETGLPLRELGSRLLIQPPSVTGVADRLERMGLVRRRPSKTDRRVRHLSLTAPGRELVATVLRGHPKQIQSLFAGLRQDEQETLRGLVDRLEQHLGTLLPKSPAMLAGVKDHAQGKAREDSGPI
jgi:MarR family transcriptional regulator, 2-MHQ and catechol-resistance regulon repressor